jgi:hypothetical protein
VASKDKGTQEDEIKKESSFYISRTEKRKLGS